MQNKTILVVDDEEKIVEVIRAEPKSPRYILTVYGVGYKFGGDSDEV